MNNLVAWLGRVLDEQERDGHSIDYMQTGEFLVADAVAKRAILALHKEVGYSEFDLGTGQRLERVRYCETCQRGDGDGEDELTYPCPTLRLLASAYVDYIGYREEFKMDTPSSTS